MNFAQAVRQRINSLRERELRIYNTLLSRSQEYMSALKIDHNDLEMLERHQRPKSMWPDLAELGSSGILTLAVEAENFSLIVMHICCVPYGGQWTTCVMAICTSDQTINETVGNGTTLINIVPDSYHAKLLMSLKAGS